MEKNYTNHSELICNIWEKVQLTSTNIKVEKYVIKI